MAVAPSPPSWEEEPFAAGKQALQRLWSQLKPQYEGQYVAIYQGAGSWE